MVNILIPPNILYRTIENSSPNIAVIQSITQRWTKKQFSCTKGVWVLLIVVHCQTSCIHTTVKPYGLYYTIPALPSLHSPHLFTAACVDYTAGSSTPQMIVNAPLILDPSAVSRHHRSLPQIIVCWSSYPHPPFPPPSNGLGEGHILHSKLYVATSF